MPCWIESHTTIRFHKKLPLLCQLLSVNRPQAIGHLHCLWWWAIENREDGDLTGLTPKDIALAGDWEGDPQTFIDALHKSKWITENKINDWIIYAGRLLRDRIRKRYEREEKVATLFNAEEMKRCAPPTHETIISQKKLVDLWNSICTKLNPIKEVSQARARKIKARLAEHPDMNYWEHAFKKLNDSAFCTGENDSEWKATFDWVMINDNNVVKISEGAYDRKRSQDHGVPDQAERERALPFAAREQLRRDREKRTSPGTVAGGVADRPVLSPAGS